MSTHAAVARVYRHACFLDEVAGRFLTEARQNYAARNLAQVFVVDQGNECQILTWLGDAANEAVSCLLILRGFVASPAGPGVEVRKGERSIEEVLDALFDSAMDDPPTLDMLLWDIKNLQREKWDWVLPDGLLRRSYASLYLDLDEALQWAKRIAGLNRERRMW